MEKMLDNFMLDDLLAYASSVAAGQEAEKAIRKAAWQKLQKDNPALAHLLTGIVAQEWGSVEREIKDLMQVMVIDAPML